MRYPKPNCSLLRIPASFRYAGVLVQGAPRPGETASRPPMDRGHRAKLFAPFDALDGYSDQIRARNKDLVESIEKNSRQARKDLLDEPGFLVYDGTND